MLVISFIGYGQNAFAASVDKAMASCLFDVVEKTLPEYFPPSVQTEEWKNDDGSITFARVYPDSLYNSALAISDDGKGAYYALYEEWTYFSDFEYANKVYAGGKCKSQDKNQDRAFICGTPEEPQQLVPSSVAQKTVLWTNGKVLNVAFDFQNQDFRNTPICSTSTSSLHCETLVKAEVARAASLWSQYGNIKFKFDVPWSDGDIRISFNYSTASDSQVGTDATKVPKSSYTMRLEVARDDFTGTVIHEFGHAIGFHHEHQNPSVSYTWNKEQIYTDTARWGWNPNQTDYNIIYPLTMRISKTDLVNTDYDPQSIMVYPIPSRWVSESDRANPSLCPSTDPYYCVEDTSSLSELDKWTVAQIYPFSVSCSYTISPSQANAANSGQAGSATVTTQSNCAWTASSNVSWITLSTASGKGNGQVSYNVAANSTTSARTGTITVGDKTIVINQAGTTVSTSFNASLRSVKYEYNSSCTSQYPVLVQLLFDAQGVNQSDLYVVFDDQPSTSYKVAVTQQGLLHAFCSLPSLKFDFSFRLKESSSGRLSNLMTTPIDTTIKSDSFNASLRSVKYEYNSSSCSSEFPVLVQLLFDAQGVNQSDLVYVQEQPSLYEEKVSLTQQGLLRAFCSIASWKTTLSFRLRESSSGRLSNLMTTAIDTTVKPDNSPLFINISGQFNNITVLPATGTGDSGNKPVSGMNQNLTFYLSTGNNAIISVSGQFNKIYISSRVSENVSYSGSGQFNEVIKI